MRSVPTYLKFPQAAFCSLAFSFSLPSVPVSNLSSFDFRLPTFVSRPLLSSFDFLPSTIYLPSPFDIRLASLLLCRIASCQPSDIIRYYQHLCSPLIFAELAVLASFATISPPTYPPFSPPAAILEQAEQNALIFTNQVLGRFTHSVSHYSLSSFQRHQRIVG